MLKRYFMKYLYLSLILLIFCTNICYATVVAVTDENLEDSLQKFVLSKANKDNYNITVSNNVITVTVDNESYILNYDLTDKPTFLMEVPIQKGMSYEDFEKKKDNLILPMLGYIAVANVQGVEVEAASTYFLLSYLKSALNGSVLTENQYIIVDDLNFSSEGGTIEKTDNPKTIYTSEFGDRVIEFVNNMYKEKQTISDSTGINSYVLTIEKLDMTDTSCKLVSKLSVNLDSDFSKITELPSDSSINSDITKENADLVVTLKVGQKCKIESIEKITGYEFYGYDCIELNDDKTEITATSVGTKNGYLYIGEEKISIYVTVEENPENANLETITLKIDSVPEVKPPNNSEEEKQDEKPEIKEEKDNNESAKDNTVSSSKLPQAGIDNSKVMIIITFIVIIIVLGIKLRKFET